MTIEFIPPAPDQPAPTGMEVIETRTIANGEGPLTLSWPHSRYHTIRATVENVTVSELSGLFMQFVESGVVADAAATYKWSNVTYGAGGVVYDREGTADADAIRLVHASYRPKADPFQHIWASIDVLPEPLSQTGPSLVVQGGSIDQLDRTAFMCGSATQMADTRCNGLRFLPEGAATFTGGRIILTGMLK